jgi:RNA recognition motif-containing protein
MISSSTIVTDAESTSASDDVETGFSTLMIRNIPNRYTPETLVEEIRGTGNDVDFVHLPKAKNTQANLGYAFVNFVTPAAARDFLEVFEGHQWIKQPNSKKRATLSWAKLQGFTENFEFYSQKKIAAKLERQPWTARAI